MQGNNFPEKIWDFWPHDGGNAVIWREPCPFPADDAEVIEYIRATHARALVAAAYEDAAASLEERGSDGWAENVMAEYASVMGEAIRARTDENAEKALADLLKAEREKALREAADALKAPRFCLEQDMQRAEAIHECRHAILAIIEEKEPGHE